MQNPYAAPQAGLELPFAPSNEARLFCWNGRIGRVRFVAYSLAGIPLAILFGLLSGIAVGIFGLQSYFASEARVMTMGTVIVMIPLLVLAVMTRRRLHDFDVGGWWTLMLLFPILQFIFLIYMVVAPGTADTNRFGAVPAPADFGVKLGAALGCILLAAFTALRFL